MKLPHKDILIKTHALVTCVVIALPHTGSHTSRSLNTPLSTTTWTVRDAQQHFFWANQQIQELFGCDNTYLSWQNLLMFWQGFAGSLYLQDTQISCNHTCPLQVYVLQQGWPWLNVYYIFIKWRSAIQVEQHRWTSQGSKWVMECLTLDSWIESWNIYPGCLSSLLQNGC